jgi:thiol-disulfide isomerase/thioredoxin
MLRARYYTASWCLPCRSFRPVAERVFAEWKIPLLFIDVENALEAAANDNVTSVPTIIMTDGDGEVDRIVGAFPEPRLKERLADIFERNQIA